MLGLSLRLGRKCILGLGAVLSIAPLCGTASAQQATLERVKRIGEIKVCVDQNNLPYSSDKPDVLGYDVEIAQQIAKEMGIKLGYNWFASNIGKRALRQMVGEGNCDFFMGLPKDDSFEDSNFKILLSKPYYLGGFATLVRSDAPATALADAKMKGVGVQLGTFVDFKLFDKGFERKLYRNSKEMFEAVAHKEIDVAVTSAPEGAWLVKSSGDTRLKLLTNTEKEFMFPMAIGVRKADKDLKEAIDAAVDKITADGRLAAIFAKYGMVQLVAEGGAAPEAAKADAPKTEAPKAEAPKADAPKPDAPKTETPKTDAPKTEIPKTEAPKADAGQTGDKPVAAAAPVAATAAVPEHFEYATPEGVPVVDPTKMDDFPSDPKTVDNGRKLYKQACYKCHGPNGVSGGTIPDLRKYAANHDHFDMFAIIQGGRLDKGMPKWAEYLNDVEIKSIIVYVKALPKD